MPRIEIPTTQTTLNELLGSNNPYCDHILVQARAGNSGIIEVGPKDDCVVELVASQSTSLGLNNLNTTAIKADSAGQIANIIVVRK